jgi:hypothetical protein
MQRLIHAEPLALLDIDAIRRNATSDGKCVRNDVVSAAEWAVWDGMIQAAAAELLQDVFARLPLNKRQKLRQ